MQLQLAKLENIKAIMEVFQQGIEYIGKQGSPQWQNGYGPQESQIKRDIQNQQLYLLWDQNNQKIVAIAALIEGIDPVYTAIEGTWQGGDKYISIHRFVVALEYMGKGMAKYFLKLLITQCQKLDYQDIRIDTHEMNIGMQKAILANDFTYCGKVVFPIPFGERLAYQLYLG